MGEPFQSDGCETPGAEPRAGRVCDPSSHCDAMAEITSKNEKPLLKEGIVIRKSSGGQPEVVILGFIPADERKFGYNLLFGLTLTVFQVAKYGGRPYSTGMYFAGKAKDILGEDVPAAWQP